MMLIGKVAVNTHLAGRSREIVVPAPIYGPEISAVFSRWPRLEGCFSEWPKLVGDDGPGCRSIRLRFHGGIQGYNVVSSHLWMHR